MKYLLLLSSLFFFCTSFGQWTRVQQLPSSNIFTLFHKGSVLYAGGTNVIYVGKNNGQTWDSTTAIPGLSPISSIIDNIIVYNNELYASARPSGVFKSADGGLTWQNINAGIDFPTTITDFCEYRADLFAATDGNFGAPVFKLDPVNKTHWLSFSNGLSGISTNVNSIIGTTTTLIAGTNNNSLYDYLPPNSTTWQERFLTDPPINTEGVFDIVTAHDTLFLAGKTGFFYMSIDNGLNWNFFGSRLVTGATFLVNAKQAMISSRYIFNGVNSTLFYYIKKNSLQSPLVNFSIVDNHFTWKIDILGDKLWDASDQGLFFMPLSVLPGITEANDAIDNIPLPVNFISVGVACHGPQVLITWKASTEQNNSRFGIERSNDNVLWTEIGSVPAKGIGSSEQNYAFTDGQPLQNAYYRIVEHDANGHLQYSVLLRSFCLPADVLTLWPNPVREQLFMRMTTAAASSASIRLFDGKGALVKIEKAALVQGNNMLHVDMRLLPKGTYTVVVGKANGETVKAIHVIKQ